MREYFYAGTDIGLKATRKGVSIPLGEIPALRDALDVLGKTAEVGTVATLSSSPRAEIRVGIRHYQGHTFAELRQFVKGAKVESEWHPTQRGFTLGRSLVPTLIEAVAEVEDMLE